MKLAVLCPSWIGDAVMATPALRAIRRKFPAATIYGLARESVAETLAGSGFIDEFLVYHPRSSRASERMLGAAAQLRKLRVDSAILFTNDFRGALVAWLGRAKRRIGYDREFRGILLTDPLPIRWSVRGYEPSPIIDYYLKLAYWMGCPPEAPALELATAPLDEERADRAWRRFGLGPDDRVVALNPGAAFGPAKQWPTRSFGLLARRLVDVDQAAVVVMCGPRERTLANDIAAWSGRENRVFSLADEDVSIGLSKAVVRRSTAMVSTDSGPRHFAAAFGVPVVSLFGPTHIAWTETYYPGEIKLQRVLPCGPCQQRVCPLGHHRCMTELTVEQVHAATSELLERRRERRPMPVSA